jgi:hypothetical protein
MRCVCLRLEWAYYFAPLLREMLPHLCISLALLVLQVFQRGSMRWLWIAILAHTLVDLLADSVTLILQLSGMTALLVPEAIVTVLGALSL